MAKEEKKEVSAPKSDREVRWEKLLEVYAKQNPVKFASKKAAGEFDKIPDSFA